MHGMHSVVDWLCFAVWENGKLVRSLSLSPDGGIEENIGEPFDFERPYWGGLHPVEPDPAWEDEDPYPLPFHPLELGEVALNALFGFVIEGMPDPGSIDADSVHMHVFRVGDPSGQEQETREAAYEQAIRDVGPPRDVADGPGREDAGGQLGRVRKESSSRCALMGMPAALSLLGRKAGPGGTARANGARAMDRNSIDMGVMSTR